MTTRDNPLAPYTPPEPERVTSFTVKPKTMGTPVFGRNKGTVTLSGDAPVFGGKQFEVIQGDSPIELASRHVYQSPSADDPQSQVRALDESLRFLNTLGNLDTDLAVKVAGDQWAMSVAPEMSVAARGNVQTEGIAQQMYAALVDDQADVSKVRQYLFGSDVPDTDHRANMIRLFGQETDFLTPDAKNALLTAFGALEVGGQKQLLGLAGNYLESEAPTSEQDQAQFVVYLWGEARRIQQGELAEDTLLGQIGEVVGGPFHAITETASELWANAADPADAWYRKGLSIGQNQAISLTPWNANDPEFRYASGTADFLANFYADPLNYLFAAGVGAKLSKTVAIADDVAKGVKFSLKSIVPIYGRSVTQLPFGSRSMFTRFAWSIMAKTQDEIIEVAYRNGVMDNLAKMGSPTEIIEAFPELKALDDGVLPYIARSTDPEEIRELLRWSYKGDFAKEGSEAWTFAHEAAEQASVTLDEALETAVAQGAGYADVAQHLDAKPGVYRSIVGGDSPFLYTATADQTGGIVSVLGRKATIQDATIDGGGAFQRWLVKTGLDEFIGTRANVLSRNRGEFEALADDDLVWVYTATDRNTAAKFLEEGIDPIKKPQATGALGEPGAALDTGTYVGLTPQSVAGYGDEVVAIRVPKGAIAGSGEAYADDVFMALGDAASGGVINTAVDAKNVKRVDAAEAMSASRIGRQDYEDYITAATGGRTMDLDEAYRRYAKAQGADVIRWDNETIEVLSDRHVKSFIDNPRIDGNEFEAGLQAASFNRVLAENRLNTILGGKNVSSWIISDMPTKNPSIWAKNFKPWRYTASRSKADNWWGALRRTTHARMYNGQMPSHINLTDTSEGVWQLRNLLSQLGVPREIINPHMDAFINTPPMARYDVVREAIEDGARFIDHSLLEYNLVEHVNKQGVKSFGYINGEEIALARSRSGLGVTPRPSMPTMLTNKVHLPDPTALLSSLRRVKSAKRSNRLGALGKWNVRGLINPKTRSDRAALAKRYEALLKRRGADTSGLNPDDIMAMAYATAPGLTHGSTDGLGLAAHMMRGAGRAYSAFHTIFTVAQLAGRFMPWATRIGVEEQARGALFDLPSLMRNPVRYLETYWDSYLLTKVSGWQKKNLTAIHEALIPMAGMKGIDELTDFARKSLTPEAFARLEGRNYTTARQWRRGVSSILEEAALAGNVGSVSAGVKKTVQRRVKAANRLTDDLHLEQKFDWDDISEIQNRGWGQALTQQASATVVPLDWTPGSQTTAHIQNYAGSYANVLSQNAGDGFAQYGLGRVAARAGLGGESLKYTPESLVRTSDWGKMREHAVDIAANRGADFDNEIDLARWYLDNIIDPWVQEIFSPLWRETPDEAGRVASEILFSRNTTVTVGGQDFTLNLHTNARSDLHKAVGQLAEQADATGAMLPQRIAAYFDPYSMGQSQQNLLQKATNGIMKAFGEDVSQQLARRPAWISRYTDSFNHYRNLGMPESVASSLARDEASEMVNYVYYNMSNPTPLLKTLNKIIPFFSATWELSQTWAYKIPAQSVAGIGHATMIRKVDRAFDALVSIGLIEVDDQGEGGIDIFGKTVPLTRRFTLALEDDSTNQNLVGATLSKAGFEMLNAPRNLVEHLVNMRGMFMDDVEDVDFTNTRYELGVGRPTDPFQHGLMAVTQLSLGVNPAISYGALKLRNAMPFASDNQIVEVEDGQDLAMIAEDSGASTYEILIANKDNFVARVGEEEFNRLLSGDAPLDKVDISGMALQIPRTSLFNALTNQIIFPFGGENTIEGVGASLAPSWIQWAMRGFGMWNNGDIEDGFMPFTSTPMEQASANGALLTEYMHLEATEGAITAIGEQTEKVYKIISDHADLIVQGVDTPNPVVVNTDHPAAAEFQLEIGKLQSMNQQLHERAAANAGGNMFLRGLTGFVAPASPRQVRKEALEAQDYYTTKEWVDNQRLRGEGAEKYYLSSRTGETDVDRQMALIEGWWADPTGDVTKQILLEQYPGLAPFVQGKTFWEPGGIPPAINEFDDYVAQIESGLRQPLPDDVWIQRYLRWSIGAEKEADIRQTYDGTDVEQAAAILWDYAAWKELKEPYNEKYDTLDWEDDFHNDGSYLAWRDRNRAENPSFVDEISRMHEGTLDSIDNVIDYFATYRTFRDDDVKNALTQLKMFRQGIHDGLDGLAEERDRSAYTNTREQAVEWYFDGPVDEYYAMLETYYTRIDNATNSEEKSRIYDEITEFQNAEALKVYDYEGVEFPNILDWRWNSYTADEKEWKKQEWVSEPPEWMDLHSAQILAKEHPAIEPYIPTTPAQFDVYGTYNEYRRQIAEAEEGTADTPLGRPITTGEARKLKAKSEEWLYNELAKQGRLQEIEFREMYPIQRLSTTGQLPESLAVYVPDVNAIHDQLDLIEKGPSSQDGQNMFDILYRQVVRDMAQNPQALGELQDLGANLYDKMDVDTIFPALFYGNEYGDQ